MAPNRHEKRKAYLVLTIAINIGILFFFKYFNLFIATIENIFWHQASESGTILENVFSGTGNGALGISQIVLPVGISFFTFQALSYVIDVYRGTVNIQPNFGYFALYISCFPQLIAGPIVQYKDVCSQIDARNIDSELFAQGITRFSYGLAKKVIIANNMAKVVDLIWASDISRLDAVTAWLGALCYTFQIYYDFSGYSDMAIGLGKMLGFKFKENFNYPYRSESVQDFWRRWHISLSSWFRDYVYIPLGGSRCSMARTCLNVFIVFLLTGIWHGANWTFLVWGLSYGILLIIERLFTGKLWKACPIKFVNRIVVFLIVNFLWVVFRADNIIMAFNYIGKMFTGGLTVQNVFRYMTGMSVITFVLAILFGGFLQSYIKPRFLNKSVAVPVILILISLLFLVNGTYNPFIYYQF